MYTYFTYAATSSTEIDDVTKFVMYVIMQYQLIALWFFFYTHFE